jgi:hypothetical protein
MPKRFFILMLITGIAATAAQAQNYKTAIGLRLSSNDALVNNSISLKHFINRVVALEGLLSVDPWAVGLLAEVHQPLSSVPGLRFFFGGGGFMGFSKEFSVGAQGVLGLDYKFTKLPINFSVDWKPELEVTNGFRFEPAAVGLSARFTLK